jgi:hypothetical protein
MSKRYFKATDGKTTFFRASDTRVYASAQKTTGSVSFSAGPPGFGWVPAVEITKAEYEALVALKNARLEAVYGEGGSRYSPPYFSWVCNSQL